MVRVNLRVPVLAAVVAVALAFTMSGAAPSVHADHIPDPDFVHAPLQFVAEFHVPFGASCNIAVGTDRILMSDTSNSTIHAFDLSGNYLGPFGSLGYGATQPGDIAIGKYNVFVADLHNDLIQVFDLSGNLLGSLGATGSAPGQFSVPADIALNPTRLFVADAGNSRIQAFDLFGGAGVFGGNVLIPYGTGLGHVITPDLIALNPTRLFVADSDHLIQIFDLSGNYAGKFGSLGTGPGQFDWRGIDLAANSTHIFVADPYNSRIQMFDLSGNYAGEFGEYGDGPCGLALNPTRLFVADYYNDRVQIFALPSNGTTP